MPLLHWLTRDQDLHRARQVPYRLLEEVPEHSAGSTPNMLIQGDNLETLKSLLPYYAGKVRCIYIDPPYNTRSAFEHYDDSLEHSRWLALMLPRLEMLRELLAQNGSIWVSIDDNEGQYLKVLMDEVYGRANFVANVIWQKIYSPKNSARHFSVDHDYITVYAKDAGQWVPNPMPRTARQDRAYKNPDRDPRGPWKAGDLSARNPYSEGIYPVTTPSGRVIDGPPPGRYWAIAEDKMKALAEDGRIWWGKNGDNIPALKRFLSEVKQGRVPQTLWPYTEVGHTQDAKKEVVALFADDVFGTPKPERLIQRILHIATRPGDLVLDSFLGSGTTAAVAHKMGRNYIGIELGEHALTHCAPRLRKVIEGEQGGISKEVNWQGGGGFRFYRLGEPVFDASGQLNPGLGFAALAAHVWFSETGEPLQGIATQPFLGVHEGLAYALLYNGILGDQRIDGGNVLTRPLLARLRQQAEGFDGPWVVYGECSRMAAETLAGEGIDFKQTPYDIRAR